MSSILDDLNQIMTKFGKNAIAESVCLYLGSATTSLTYIPESNSWLSKLGKSGGAYAVVKWGVFGGDEGGVFLFKTSSKGAKFGYVTDLPPISDGFEQAVIFEGMFPLVYVCNYINLCDYKIFDRKPIDAPHETETVQNIYTPRDFAIGLIQYLEYYKRATERETLYKVVMKTTNVLMKCERDVIYKDQVVEQVLIIREY